MQIQVYEDRSVAITNNPGSQYENNVEVLEIVFPERYENYNKKIVFTLGENVEWDFINNDNTYILTRAITKYPRVKFYIWLTNENDDFRTVPQSLYFRQNEDASNDISDEDLGKVNKMLAELDAALERAEQVEDGRGIISIEKISTNLLVDTYQINYTDETTSTFEVTNGNGILRLEKIGTLGLVDSYRITFTNGTTFDYTVTNGAKGDTGEQGIQGEKGEKGDKPIKGVDYFTAEDISNMVEQITEDSKSEYNQYVTEKTAEKLEEIDEFANDVESDIADMASALTFATFDVDPTDGHLYMDTASSLGNMIFSLENNGHLVVNI